MFSRRQPRDFAISLLLIIFLPACLLADRDSSQQEEYYLKNFRNNPNRNNVDFRFVRNDKNSARKKNHGGAVPVVDIVPSSAYGERDDYSLPRFLLFVPLVGAWMAALILIRQLSPRASIIVSKACRHISDFTRTFSERTAAMHERNRRGAPSSSVVKRKDSRRRERNQESFASDQSISPSLMEMMTYDNDDEEFNTSNDQSNNSLFSSFRRAKTVITSNSQREKHHNTLREPSPARGTPSKHNKHAQTRMRRSINDDNSRTHHNEREVKKSERCNKHGDKKVSHHSHDKEYNRHHDRRTESRHHEHSSHRSGHAKTSHKHVTDMSLLEKKLSCGSQKSR